MLGQKRRNKRRRRNKGGGGGNRAITYRGINQSMVSFYSVHAAGFSLTFNVVRLGETNSRGPGLSDTPNIVLLDSSNNAVIKDTTGLNLRSISQPVTECFIVPSKVKKASKPFVNKMSVEIEAYQDANSGARSASEDSLSRRHTHVQPAPR